MLHEHKFIRKFVTNIKRICERLCMDNIIDIIKTRRSVRKYKDTIVEKETIAQILQAGAMAPSAGNSQPWEFIVVQGEYAEQISHEFYCFAQKHIQTAQYIPEEKKSEMLNYSKNFGGAPHQIVVIYSLLNNSISNQETLKSCGAAIQNILLQATASGLGTVWIGSKINHSDRVKEILKLEANKAIAGIIPIGYADENPPIPKRRDISSANNVTWLGY